jgi:putative transposon-encoded protein
MPRKIELEKGRLVLTEKEVEGFLERIVTPIGTSAKADVPRRYLGRRVYVIVTKVTGNLTKDKE